MKWIGWTLFSLAVAFLGCTSDTTEVESRRTTFGGARPVDVAVPDAYDPAQSWPLVVVLHGYSASGTLQLWYTQLEDLVDDAGVFVVAPDGTPDVRNALFWNATDACCNFLGEDVDDVAYLGGLIEEIATEYNIDAKRIYLWGHSNGGFMSYRMACDRADLIAGVISLAGGSWRDRTRCAPTEPVHVMQVHGTADDTVGYEGSALFPPVSNTMEAWADYNGCAPTAVQAEQVDLEPTLEGSETTVTRYEDCNQDVTVELWTIEGGEHIPSFPQDYPSRAWQWFDEHPKP